MAVNKLQGKNGGVKSFGASFGPRILHGHFFSHGFLLCHV